MPTVLVTGGCGFIGSNFIRHLLSTDESVRVVNFDALTYAGNLANLTDVAGHPHYTFIKGDVTDREAVRAAMSGVSDVIHFAAESHVDRSIQDSGPFLKTNVIGTQVLLDAAREFGVEKFVMVSTDEVYGSLGDTGLFTEQTPLHPNSPYSASKAAADLLVMAYQHTFGIHAVVTRCSNNYGPYQFPEKLIPLFVSNLLADQQVPVYGDGMQVRDWIHVLDHCRGVEAAWRKGRSGEAYNFGGKCEKANLHLTQLLLELLGKPQSLIKYVADRLGHDRRYAIDCSKAEAELGWQPLVPFEQGLKETIEWYTANAAWVVAIKNKDYLAYYEKQYGKPLGEPSGVSRRLAGPAALAGEAVPPPGARASRPPTLSDERIRARREQVGGRDARAPGGGLFSSPHGPSSRGPGGPGSPCWITPCVAGRPTAARSPYCRSAATGNCWRP